jgi:hypothetical protein
MLLVLCMACYAVLVCEDGSAVIGSRKCLFCRQLTQAKIERYRYEYEFLIDDKFRRFYLPSNSVEREWFVL